MTSSQHPSRSRLMRRTGAALCAAMSAALLCAAAPAWAADAPPQPNRYAATIAPAERFEVDGLLVERHGAAAGRPLILIPGLASGSWVWQDTIRAFSASHPVYVLTLPGFDGRPPAGPAPIAAARAAIEQLIAQRRLDRPVVVGQGLGGVLGIALAEQQPQAIGGLVSIDGLPVMPGTEDMAPAERARQAQQLAALAPQQPPAGFAARQQSYMRTVGVMDMGRADDVAQLTARSDPASVTRYTAEALGLDLRPALKSITAPVVVVMPYLDLDAEQTGQTEAAKLGYYRALMEGTPRVQVVPVAPARQFVTIDQPQAVNELLRAFLGSL